MEGNGFRTFQETSFHPLNLNVRKVVHSLVIFRFGGSLKEYATWKIKKQINFRPMQIARQLIAQERGTLKFASAYVLVLREVWRK